MSLTEDDIALAGEYVLGLLDLATHAAVSARIATDTEFAAEVTAWEERLLPMLGAQDTPAPDHIWPAIAAALPAVSTEQDNEGGKLWLWRAVAGFSSMAALILAVILWQQPAPPPAEPAPMVAALGSDTGKASMTIQYNAKRGEMLLTPVSLDTGKLYPELWVVPADGQARSLGLIRGDGPSQVPVTAEMRQYMSEGATLAITPEPQGGAPGGKATGPIIAAGKMVTI